jgi:hypothetical protein
MTDKLKEAKAAHKAGMTVQEYADKQAKIREEEKALKEAVSKKVKLQLEEVKAHISKICIAAEIIQTETKFLEDNKRYVTNDMNNKIKTVNRNVKTLMSSIKNKLTKEQKEWLDLATEAYCDVTTNILALTHKDLMEVNNFIVEKASEYCEVVNIDEDAE